MYLPTYILKFIYCDIDASDIMFIPRARFAVTTTIQWRGSYNKWFGKRCFRSPVAINSNSDKNLLRDYRFAAQIHTYFGGNAHISWGSVTAVNVELWIMAAAMYGPLPCRSYVICEQHSLALRSRKPVYNVLYTRSVSFIAQLICATHHTKNVSVIIFNFTLD